MSEFGFTGGHSEAYRVYLADRNDLIIRQLRHNTGRVDWTIFTEVSGGGSVEILAEPEGSVEWSHHRIVVEYVARDGAEHIEYRLFVGIVTGEEHNPVTGTTTLELMDKTVIPRDDEIYRTFSVSEGSNVVATVRDVIESTGEMLHEIEDSGETVRVASSWPPGTSKLTIINDLLASINYTPLRASGSGFLRSQHSTTSGSPLYDFRNADRTVYSPETMDERDYLNVPNQIICKSTTDGEDDPLISVVRYMDPDSEWSIPGRGRVISRTIENIDATSQSVLDEIAVGYMGSSSQVTWRQTVQHLRLNLPLNTSVIGPAGQEGNIVQTSQTLEAGALAETVIRRMDRMSPDNLEVVSNIPGGEDTPW